MSSIWKQRLTTAILITTFTAKPVRPSPNLLTPSLPKFPSSKKIKHLTPFRSTDALLFTCESFQTKALTAIIIFNHKATSEIN